MRENGFRARYTRLYHEQCSIAGWEQGKSVAAVGDRDGTVDADSFTAYPLTLMLVLQR
jgi:hypothetical protein